MCCLKFKSSSLFGRGMFFIEFNRYDMLSISISASEKYNKGL